METTTGKEVKKGWSWLGFFFMPYYYAGYGLLKKGLLFACILGLLVGVQPEWNKIVYVIFLLLGFLILVYGGLNAKKDLPIKKEKFNWLNVFWVWLAYSFSTFMTIVLFSFISSNTPKCNDNTSISMVKQITLKELDKVGYKNISIDVLNIRTFSYDETVEKYTCEAELKFHSPENNKLVTFPISYTTQATDDEKNIYVEVFGL
jgi:uncharacterized metal-binding protein